MIEPPGSQLHRPLVAIQGGGRKAAGNSEGHLKWGTTLAHDLTHTLELPLGLKGPGSPCVDGLDVSSKDLEGIGDV